MNERTPEHAPENAPASRTAADAEQSFDRCATSLTDVDPAVFEELLSMRRTIDNVDAALVHLLAERFRATQRVGYLKAEHRLPPGDPNREAAQIERLRGLAESAHLDPEFAEKFLNFIISEVIRRHERIAEEQRREDDAASADQRPPADPGESAGPRDPEGAGDAGDSAGRTL